MEKASGRGKRREKLNGLLMELFTPEFLESLPPEYINTVINKLRLLESASTPIPPEWKAIKGVLQVRGYLSINK